MPARSHPRGLTRRWAVSLRPCGHAARLLTGGRQHACQRAGRDLGCGPRRWTDARARAWAASSSPAPLRTVPRLYSAQAVRGSLGPSSRVRISSACTNRDALKQGWVRRQALAADLMQALHASKPGGAAGVRACDSTSSACKHSTAKRGNGQHSKARDSLLRTPAEAQDHSGKASGALMRGAGLLAGTEQGCQREGAQARGQRACNCSLFAIACSLRRV